MSDGLARMPGHRAVDTGAQQSETLLEILPFLPTDYQAAVPLYAALGLLFVVVSRAARRQKKNSARNRPRRTASSPQPIVRRRGETSGVRQMRPHEGHWGDG